MFFAKLGIVSEAAFHALADPRRRAILRLVRDRPRSVNEIAEKFDITQQAISLHLKVLRDAGLVAVRPHGQRRLYAVRPEGLAAAAANYQVTYWRSPDEQAKSGGCPSAFRSPAFRFAHAGYALRSVPIH